MTCLHPVGNRACEKSASRWALTEIRVRTQLLTREECARVLSLIQRQLVLNTASGSSRRQGPSMALPGAHNPSLLLFLGPMPASPGASKPVLEILSPYSTLAQSTAVIPDLRKRSPGALPRQHRGCHSPSVTSRSEALCAQSQLELFSSSRQGSPPQRALTSGSS